jgi:Tfp pilus assembly major pilin PilA
MKKAAMFGLDARIALAIFGALSVISGAALYSAIQQAKVVAIVTEMSEAGKAYEQYILDTGIDLERFPDPSGTHMVSGHLLEDSGAEGWNGPYLPYTIDSSDAAKTRLLHPQYNLVIFINSTGNAWGGAVGQESCLSNCQVWVRFDIVEDSLAEAVDIYVDGTQDDQNGKVKLYRLSGANAGKSHLYLNTGPTLR